MKTAADLSVQEIRDGYGRLEARIDDLLEAIQTRMLEHFELKEALSKCRESCRIQHGVTTRKFAELCGITPTLLCKWTSPTVEELGEPDIICQRHVCGLEGFNQMIDPPCPACEEHQ